ncbi:hypothetical protein [Leptospira limi]|uniref:Uncharacterized protein n=1 Tax=Leptospira limi TaxID=2950023 RepID=A0ABT3LSP9_9LEPT|nr:hypothetical protein [Leptospira limi]MCW7460761.1 hypothetical protein [Leptospira limi]
MNFQCFPEMKILIGSVPRADDAAWIRSMTIDVSTGPLLQSYITNDKRVKITFFKKYYLSRIKLSDSLLIAPS